MNLGIDIDGVTANIDDEMIRRLKNEHNMESDINKWHSYFMEENHPHIPTDWFVKQFDDPTLWLNAQPYDDMWHMVNKWFGDCHNIFFITSRPKSVWEITYRWLDEWYIGYNDVYCGIKKYSKCELVEQLSLDLFIEDDPIEARIISSYTTSFLLDKPYNRKYDIGDAERVKDAYVIDDWIQECKASNAIIAEKGIL